MKRARVRASSTVSRERDGGRERRRCYRRMQRTVTMEGSQPRPRLATAAPCLPQFAEWLTLSLSATLDRHPVLGNPPSLSISLAASPREHSVSTGCSPADPATLRGHHRDDRGAPTIALAVLVAIHVRVISSGCHSVHIFTARAGHTTTVGVRIQYKMAEMKGNKSMIQMRDCTLVAVSICGRASLVALHV